MIGYIILSLLPGPLRRNFSVATCGSTWMFPKRMKMRYLVCLSRIIIWRRLVCLLILVNRRKTNQRKQTALGVSDGETIGWQLRDADTVEF